jgi:hypothetical protein
MPTQSNMENSLPSQQTHWSSDRMTGYEKEHYKKALKEIYDAVKLRTQRLDTESGSDEDVQLDGTVYKQESFCSLPKSVLILN